MAEFEWIVQIYGRKEPIEFDENQIPLKEWGTICFNRRGDSLRGKYPMEPMTLKACVNIYRRFFVPPSVVCKYNNIEQHIRIYNVNTGEVVPCEAL